MKAEPLAIPGPLLLQPVRHADARGYFCETYRHDRIGPLIGGAGFVQDNEALSQRAGTIRGLHLQGAPSPQGKLVRVARGAIFDVIVDVRAGSAHFGQHVAVRLDAEQGRLLWVPPGFLHGFCTLEDATLVLYKVTAPYDPAAEAGVLWCDPALAIAWPVAPGAAIVSARDAALPPLSALTPVTAD